MHLNFIDGRDIEMKVKSSVKAGGLNAQNHNQTVKGLRVKSSVKAGGLNTYNHNQTTARRAR